MPGSKQRVYGTLILGLVGPMGGVLAQEPVHRVALGAGAVLFTAANDGQNSVGVFLRGALRLARLGSYSTLNVEATVSNYYMSGEACTAAFAPPPSSCAPLGPPEAVWSGQVGVAVARRAPSPILLAGFDAYSNVNASSGKSQAAVGFDLGLGAALSPRLTLDGRFVWLRSSPWRAWSLPVGITVPL